MTTNADHEAFNGATGHSPLSRHGEGGAIPAGKDNQPSSGSGGAPHALLRQDEREDRTRSAPSQPGPTGRDRAPAEGRPLSLSR